MATLRNDQALLAVIAYTDGWRILPGGEDLAPFASQAAAIGVARRLIGLAELSGRELRLLVHDAFGELREAPPEKHAPSLQADSPIRPTASEPVARRIRPPVPEPISLH